MTTTPIQVECYAGGRSDERPRRLTVGARTHVVARLLSESVEESTITGGRTRRYRVLTLDGLVLEITHTCDDGWFLVSTRNANEVDSGN
ncbi:MAG TPA: hypothetical protein VFF31_12815 [Blastocatellia bacterium]|nr:hypothetical protein [Blastocatellia bacterium]